MHDDRNVRLRALDPASSFIVQAPAGSGKTELLTQRFLRLLTTVDHPEQILAITFTRKAAAEMRKRIFDALHASQDEAPESAHKRATWDLARAVMERDEQKRWRLLEQPARLRIQTIDALNAMLARRLPVVAGLGAPLEPTDDPDPLYYEAGARLIERLGEGSEEARAIERLIVHLGNRVERFVELLAELLRKRDQWLGAIVDARDTEQLRASLEAALERVIAHHLQQLYRALSAEQRTSIWELTQYAADNLLRDAAMDGERRRTLEACAKSDAGLREGSECLEAWRAVAEVFLKKDKAELYEVVKKNQGFPIEPAAIKKRMMLLLDELREDEELVALIAALRHLPPPLYTETQWQVLEALLAVLPLAVAEVQLVFQSQGQADYVEAALRALRALGSDEQPTDLALAFDYRLQHVLIDEFQDTSYAQLELLERLTAGWQADDGRTLFCVGDPMQSIYRFRQAEVGLFLQLQRQGLRHVKLEPLTLTSNFRSIPAVVSWVNEVFPRVLSNRSDPELGAVAYSPSIAALADRDGGVFVHPSIEGDAAEEAIEAAELVQQLLDRDKTSRVAILVSARSHVAEIANALSRNDIDFQAVEIEKLLDRPVVQDLIALTRALVHVGDRTAWLAVLRAPWCGLGLTDLHLLFGRNDGEQPSVLDALQKRSITLTRESEGRLKRTHDILEQALAERGRLHLREWVERTWLALGGPATLQRQQDLDDAEAYLQRLEELEIAGDLEDVAALESQLEKLFARPRAQRGRVEIMTIHKAKGLEFEYVILPSLERYAKGEDRELMRWMRTPGREGGVVFAPIKADGADPDPVYRWIALMERERTLRERARLLYVAATRAKRELHLFGSVNAKPTDEGLALGEPRQGSMLKMLWHAVRSAFEGALDDPHARSSQVESVPPLTSLRRLPMNWVPVTLETGSQLTQARLLSPPKRRPDFDWVSETGRHVGTIVHRELERLTRNAPRADEVSDPLRMRERLTTELAELGVPEERRAIALERTIAAIQSTLNDDRGRWLLGLRGGLSDAESELALTGFVRGQLVDGVIDRTFRDASGVRWIVDFKTSTHEGAGLEHFLAEEEVRYRDQLTRYAALMRAYKPGEQVRAALYFPLLKTWREVDVPQSTNVNTSTKSQMDLFG